MLFLLVYDLHLLGDEGVKLLLLLCNELDVVLSYFLDGSICILQVVCADLNVLIEELFEIVNLHDGNQILLLVKSRLEAAFSEIFVMV